MSSADSKQKIGNPLTEAAASGMLGGARRPIGTRESGNETPAPPPERQQEAVKETVPTQAEEKRVGRRKSNRVREKKTVLLAPDLALWLDIQSAKERRELSDIVADSLELYKKLHAEQS